MGAQVGRFDTLAGHARRVSELGVIVVTKKVGQGLAGWTVRVDVRVRIDQGQRIEFLEQAVV